MGRLSPRSNDLPNLPNLHQPPQRSLYGNDGNDGRTPGGWRVQLAEGDHQLDQEAQACGGISRRGARRGAGTLRVEPLVREDGGAKRRSPNRSRAARARLEELPARRQRTVPGGGELFRDPWGPRGQHPARTSPACWVLQRSAPKADKYFRAQTYGLLGAAYENALRPKDAATAYEAAAAAAL